jgi:tetratricopeptide (TPR) repeat protein
LRHLDDDRVANLAQGLLRGTELLEVEEHLDRCDACRKLLRDAVSAIATTNPSRPTVTIDPDEARTPPVPDELPRGTLVGRYVVISRLGAGGMGVVYAAFDPELDRRVALKLLRPDLRIDTEKGGSRLLREAQALARLSHPNLVTVFDVGVFQGSVFLAMELIDGGTLRDWTRGRNRPWRAVLTAYLEAGDGLAAAHTAGLVHRDFKSANVLRGKDGRVRVTDFGLARLVTAADPAGEVPRDPPHGPHPLETPLTMTGAFVGTARYMSPEQLQGRSADARSDQFSYCVALFEALFGERPFEGRSILDLRGAMASGAIRPFPARSRVPARVRRALLRGLSIEPARRFDTLEALLAALRRDPARGWRRWGATAAITLSVAAFGGRWAYHRVLHHRECERSASLESIWGPSRRAQAKQFYLAAGGPEAVVAWSKLESELDAYTRRWSAMEQDACAAMPTAASDVMGLERRKACLLQRRYQLKAVADLLASGDPAARDARSRLTRSLGSLSDCGVSPQPPPSTSLSAEQEHVLADIARATACVTVGKFKEGIRIASDAAALAKGIPDPTLTGRAFRVLGELQELAGDPDGAALTLRAAVNRSEAAGDDETLFETHRDLLLVEGIRLGDERAGRREADEASAMLTRLGSRSEPTARLALYLGDALSEWGDKKEAEAQFRKAIALEKELDGADSPEVAIGRMDLALNLREDGRFEEAWAEGRSALAAVDRSETSRSDIAFLEKGLGELANSAGRFDEGERSLRRAVDIFQGAAEPDGQSVDALLSLGEALAELGRYDESARVLEQVESSPIRDDAVRLQAQSERAKVDALRGDYAHAVGRLSELAAEARQGPSGRTWVLELVLLDLGTAQLNAGDLKSALRTLQEDRHIVAQSQNPDSVFVIEGEARLAAALQRAGRGAEALPRFERVLKLEESALGTHAPALSLPLAGIGRHFLDGGEPKKAAPLLERALSLAEQVPGERFDLATIRFLLARALDAGGDRARAAALAVQASDGFRQGQGDGRRLDEVEQWRIAHPTPAP